MNVETLIQGGAVGIAILVVTLGFYDRRSFLKIISNHITHNTKVLQELLDYLKKNNGR